MSSPVPIPVPAGPFLSVEHLEAFIKEQGGRIGMPAFVLHRAKGAANKDTGLLPLSSIDHLFDPPVLDDLIKEIQTNPRYVNMTVAATAKS